MVPNVVVRYGLPLEADHYTTQLLIGHGDFRGKLHQFRLAETLNCQAQGCAGSETARNVLENARGRRYGGTNSEGSLRKKANSGPIILIS